MGAVLTFKWFLECFALLGLLESRDAIALIICLCLAPSDSKQNVSPFLVSVLKTISRLHPRSQAPVAERSYPVRYFVALES